MNKEECEKKIKEWKAKRVKMFCPMIKDRCQLDCVSMNMMVIDDTFTSEFITLGGYCTCYALTGGA